MRIGLITMHRVINYGSILQAYATQYIINKSGHDCKIIDYQYPNDIHEQRRFSIKDIGMMIARFFLQMKQSI